MTTAALLILALALFGLGLFLGWVAIAALTDLLDLGADSLRQALGLVPGRGHNGKES